MSNPNNSDSENNRRSFLLNSVLGTTGVAAAGLLSSNNSAQASTATSNNIFRTEEHNVFPNGLSAKGALQALFNRVPDGAVIVFMPGIYDLSNWSRYTINKSITLTSYEGTVTLKGPGNDDINNNKFIRIIDNGKDSSVSVTIDGLSFDTWGRTLEVLNNSGAALESIVVKNCRFNSVYMGINAYGGSPTDTGGLRKVNHFHIENCNISNCINNAVFLTSLFDSAFIANNRIENVSASAITLGNTNHGSAYVQNENNWRKAVIIQNWCANLSVSGAHVDVHGIIAAGREIIVSHNHIENVSNGGSTGAEGIYLKARYSEVSHNMLINAGMKEGAIALKGTERNTVSATTAKGYANRISNNTIINTRPGDHRGMMVFTSDVLISNNYLEGVSAAIRAIGKDGNILIEGNMMRDITGHGIKVDTEGDNILIKNNIIQLLLPTDTLTLMASSNLQGIWLLAKQGAADWVASGNTVSTKDSSGNHFGIYIEGNQQGMSGLVISSNQLAGLSYGIYTTASKVPNFSHNGAWIHSNYFRNCDNNIASTLKNLSPQVIVQHNLPSDET